MSESVSGIREYERECEQDPECERTCVGGPFMLTLLLTLPLTLPLALLPTLPLTHFFVFYGQNV